MMSIAGNRSSVSSTSYSYSGSGRSNRRRADNVVEASSSCRNIVRSPLYPALSSQQSASGSIHHSSSSCERERQQRQIYDPHERVVMSQLTMDSSMRSHVTFNGMPSLEQPSASTPSFTSSADNVPRSTRNGELHGSGHYQPGRVEDGLQEHQSISSNGRRRSSSSSSIFKANGSSILKTSTSHRQRGCSSGEHSRGSSSRAFSSSPHHYASSRNSSPRREPTEGPGHRQNQVFTSSRNPSFCHHERGQQCAVQDLTSDIKNSGTPGNTSWSLLQQEAAKRISPSAVKDRLKVPYPQLSKYGEETVAQLANAKVIIGDYRIDKSPIMVQPFLQPKADQDDMGVANGGNIIKRTTSNNSPNDLCYLAQDSISEASSGQNINAPIHSSRSESSTVPASSAAVTTTRNIAIQNKAGEDQCYGENILAALDSLLAKKKSEIEEDLLKHVQERMEDKLNEKVTTINHDMDAKVKGFEAAAESRFENLLENAKKAAVLELAQKVEELKTETVTDLDGRLEAITDSVKTTESALESKLQERFHIMETAAESRIDQKVIQVEGSFQKMAAEAVAKLQNKLGDCIGQLRGSVPRIGCDSWDDVKRVTSLVLENCRAFTTSASMTTVPKTSNDSARIQQSTGWAVTRKSIAASPSDKSPRPRLRRSKTARVCHSEGTSSVPMTGQSRGEIELQEPLSKRQRSSSSRTRARSLTQSPKEDSGELSKQTTNAPSGRSQQKERKFSTSTLKLPTEKKASNGRKNSAAVIVNTDEHEDNSFRISSRDGVSSAKKESGGINLAGRRPKTTDHCLDHGAMIDGNQENRITKRMHLANDACIGSSFKNDNGNKKVKLTPIDSFTANKRRLVSPHLSKTQKKPNTTKHVGSSAAMERSSSSKRPTSRYGGGISTSQGHRFRRRSKGHKIASKAQIHTEETTKNRSPLARDLTNTIPVPLEVFANFDQVPFSSPLEIFPFCSQDMVVDSTESSRRPNSEKASQAKVPAAAPVSTKKMKGRIRGTYGSRRKPFDVTSPHEKEFSFE